MKITLALSILTSSLSLLNLAGADEIIQVHGSGTTNPSKCIWHIMSLFNGGSRAPIRMTYRAVGSTTGQKEFLGGENSTVALVPRNDFGAGDIPISKERFDLLQEHAFPEGDSSVKKMVHLPFALSSVSFFYRIDGVDEVDLDACELAKIFRRKITSWDDPEIVKNNPALAKKDIKIRVCRRTNGSSSTASITKFLNRRCPAEWPDDMVASKLTNWDADTKAVEGSAGMTACIDDNDGAIGYMESGHGWSESLQEVSVLNADGEYITSKTAFENGGIASAASGAELPSNLDDDWSAVDFIDKKGKGTYPIVLMSYVYVRRHISEFMQDEHNRGLFKLFLESLYMENYIGNCADLAFTPVPTQVKTNAVKSISSKIIWNFSNTVNPWIFETSTEAYFGADDYVISSKRKSYQGVEFDSIAGMEAKQLQEIKELFELAEMKLDYNLFTDYQKGRINTAIILSSISFALWGVLVFGFIIRKYVFRM